MLRSRFAEASRSVKTFDVVLHGTSLDCERWHPIIDRVLEKLGVPDDHPARNPLCG
jgi:hypothetical protein